MRVAALVAIDLDRVIGRDNALPWRLPADLKRFKRLTLGKPVVMGRRTYESIGRPLPDRHNIVVSGRPGFTAPGCEVVRSLDEALAAAARYGGDEAMIIGGARLFEEALPRCDRIYLSVVMARVGGDTFLPKFDERDWVEIAREDCPADATNAYAHRFLVLERRREGAPAGRPFNWAEIEHAG
jgi:dihydrofolate reductase